MLISGRFRSCVVVAQAQGQWKNAFLVRRKAKGLRFYRELACHGRHLVLRRLYGRELFRRRHRFPQTVRALVGEQPAAQPAFSLARSAPP